MPYASITKISGTTPQFRWTYTSADEKLKTIKWEQLNTSPVKVTNISTITYDAGKLSKIEIDMDGGIKRTFTVTYNSQGRYQKSTDVYSSNPNQIWNVEAEYDASGRIEQWNRYRTTTGSISNASTREFTYDAAGNVTKVKQTDGSLVTNMTVTYDNKTNKAYLQPELLALLFGDFSDALPMIWAGTVPQLIPLSKNHPVEIVRQNASQNMKITLAYTFDANGNITKVVEQWFDMLNGGSKINEVTFEVTIP
ncbi:DUF4595 domain-containing protein [Pedobacter sp. BS3]|uniref:DUF4595 domain-containing protein n=1 Tax=Pedobacter sp. BS3 TaxID=2567937 RepID=UPI0011ECB71F|nr:DUF4595 domain-containing protein [Pedobacter sp. BS3]TZF81458.1 DUF4595 domain-containing protein [Pedobacter sp. BS3]